MKMRSYRSLPHLSLNNIMVIQMEKRKLHVDAINLEQGGRWVGCVFR